MNGLTWEDPSLIGFVIACYQSCALENVDLRQWAEHILATRDDFPSYILDLMEYDGTRAKIARTVGFHPPSGLGNRQSLALSGIAYVRGFGPFDDASPEAAIAALRACPEVLKRFQATFPFITVGDVS